MVPENLELSATIIDYAGHSETIYAYTVPISETQELQVEVQVDGINNYEVLRWQAVPIGDWTPDDGMELWDMEMF